MVKRVSKTGALLFSLILAGSLFGDEKNPLSDLKKDIVLYFSFNDGTQPDYPSGTGMEAGFKRDSVAYVDGKKIEKDIPKLVEGKFGKGLMIEEPKTNLFSLNQSNVEKDTSCYVSLKGTVLSLSSDKPWEGKHCLKVATTGEKFQEGFSTTDIKVEKVLFYGNVISPAHYIASVYLKGEGKIKLSLKDAKTNIAGEPVYLDLTNDWKRYFCRFAFPFKTKSVGYGHESDWKNFLPPDTPIDSQLQLACTTADKEKTTFYADGLQVEKRPLPFSPTYGSGLSPLSWGEGSMQIAQDQFSFSTREDIFNQWEKTGTISFWFKPLWDTKDGTADEILYIAHGKIYLSHGYGKIRMRPSGTDTSPANWKDNWHHIGITWNEEGERILYVDGVPYPNKKEEKMPMVNSVYFSFGHTAGGRFHFPNGILDDLTLFQKTLTPEQIKSIYESGGKE
jgi:hypothetical protein